MAETVEIIVEGRDRLSGPLGTARAKLEQLGQSIRGATGGLSGMGTAAQATAAHASGLGTATAHANRSVGMLSIGLQGMIQVAAGIGVYRGVASIMGEVSNAFIGFNANMEQSKIAFTTMLGGAAEAEAMLKKLYDFAALTPFQFPEVVQATKQLLAYGFAAKDVIPMLTSIGDAVAGLGGGPEMISRITRALGQMQAKGRVTAEEMLQLTEANIPAWAILSEAMGKSTAELMKLSEKGLLPADKAIKALVDGMEKRFPNMMAKQSASFIGLMSTLKDRVIGGLSKLGLPFFEAGEAAIKGLTDAMASPNITAGIDNMSNNIRKALAGIGDVFANINLDKLNEAFSRVDFSAIADAFGTIGKAVGGLAGKVAPIVSDIAGFAANYLIGGIQAVAGALVTMAKAVGALASSAWNKVKDGLDAVAGGKGKAAEIGGKEIFGISIAEIAGIGAALLIAGKMLGGLGGILAKVVVSFSGLIASVVGGLVSFTSFTAVGATLSAALGGLGAAIGALLSILAPVAIAIAALAAGFLIANAAVQRIWGSWEKLSNAAVQLGQRIVLLAQVIGEALGDAINTAITGFQRAWETLWNALPEPVTEMFKAVSDLIAEWSPRIIGGMAQLAVDAVTSFRDNILYNIPGVKAAFDALGNAWNEAGRRQSAMTAGVEVMTRKTRTLTAEQYDLARGIKNTGAAGTQAEKAVKEYLASFNTAEAQAQVNGLGTVGQTAADKMQELRNQMQGIADIKLFGETDISDELFRMEIEAKKLQLRILEVGGSGSEGAKEYEAALKALQRQMEMTRLKAEIEFEPQKRMIERLVNPIEELSLQQKLDALIALNPNTIRGLKDAAEAVGFTVTDITTLVDIAPTLKFNALEQQWLLISTYAKDMLAAILMAQTFKFLPPNIPGFQGGGKVPGPKGAPMLAIVHGGERITPPGTNRTQNDNRNVTVNVYANQGNVADRFAADPRIKEYLKPKARW